jgi:hypothetical protein
LVDRLGFLHIQEGPGLNVDLKSGTLLFFFVIFCSLPRQTYVWYLMLAGARGGAVGWGTALQAGSIPDGVIGIFHWLNTSGRTVALESAQPLKEMSTRNVSWG